MTSEALGIAPVDIDGCIAALQLRLGVTGLYTAREDCARYEKGARYGAGRAAFVVRPASAEEVSFVVRTCSQHGVAIVPQGANTGLVGASTPDASGTQCVMTLERLTAAYELNRINRSVVVSAGMRLSALNEALRGDDLWFPIDLGADPSVGGMVSTNTGGTRFIRYGDVRRNVLGLEIVLPDGEILNLMEHVRKNNTGLDAKQLFIGTSGKLGIVTKAVLEVHPLPRASATAMLVPTSEESILAILVEMEDRFGPKLTSFEGMSGTALACALDHGQRLRNPFSEDGFPNYALLVEISDWGSEAGDSALQEMLEDNLAGMLDRELIGNAFMQDAENLWSIRHHISDSLKSQGSVIALDICVSRDRFVKFRTAARQAVHALAGHILVADFGHVGDGATHFNMIWPSEVPYDDEVAEALRVAVYDVVRDNGGSFSAEHGVGPFNEHFCDRYLTAGRRALEAAITAVLDPNPPRSNGQPAGRDGSVRTDGTRSLFDS